MLVEAMFVPSIEHQGGSMAGKWELSDSREHMASCHEQFDFLHPRDLATLQNFSNKQDWGENRMWWHY